jgi:hypothetical protein
LLSLLPSFPFNESRYLFTPLNTKRETRRHLPLSPFHSFNPHFSFSFRAHSRQNESRFCFQKGKSSSYRRQLHHLFRATRTDRCEPYHSSIMAATIKKAAQAVANVLPIGTDSTQPSSSSPSSSSTSRPTEITIPSTLNPFKSGGSVGKPMATPRTPRTPADEAIAYFSSDAGSKEDVQIWVLPLEDDGGPNHARSVSVIYPFDESWALADVMPPCSVTCSTSGFLLLPPLISSGSSSLPALWVLGTVCSSRISLSMEVHLSEGYGRSCQAM